jgi:hypothetical protein
MVFLRHRSAIDKRRDFVSRELIQVISTLLVEKHLEPIPNSIFTLLMRVFSVLMVPMFLHFRGKRDWNRRHIRHL